MAILKNKFFAAFFALFLLLFDGHLSQVLTQMTSRNYIFSSQLFLIVLVFYTFYPSFSSLFIVTLTLSLGMFYDIYYLNVIGIQTFSLLLVLYLFIFFNRRLAFSFFKEFLLFLCLSAFLDCLNYGLAFFFRLTSYPLETFLLRNLLPSLLLNTFLFLIFYLTFGKAYLKQFN